MPTSAATISSVINLGLPAGTPENFTDPQSIALYQLLVQTAQNLLTAIERGTGLSQKPMTQWNSLNPSDTLIRQNAGRLYVIFSETVAYGALVNLYNNAGKLTARNSNSTDPLKRATGYCNVNNSIQSGAGLGEYGEVILSQGIIGVGGVLPGDLLFLAPSDGQMQIGPDITAGHIEQFIGIGIAPNLVYIDISLGSWIQH